MIIRAATTADFDAIDRLTGVAFAASDFGHNGEADLVRTLYSDGDVLVSLVAKMGDELIGHMLLSRMAVEADGCMIEAAALAPVSVLPSAQSQGIGSALITAGLAQLKADGFQISFVFGHPDYYPRFGYSAVLAAPFSSPYAGEHFMAVYLDSRFALPQRGKAEYAPAFARMG